MFAKFRGLRTSWGLEDLSNDEAALVIREAQATCVRLADDALGAAEESQQLSFCREAGQLGVSLSGYLVEAKRKPATHV